MKNKMLSGLTLALLIGVMSSLAFAQAAPSAPKDPAEAPKEKKLSAEDRAAMKTMLKEHQAKINPIEDKLWAKQKEYDFLVDNPNTKLNDIKPVIEEISKLRGQLRDERNNFTDQMAEKGFHHALPGFRGGDHLMMGKGEGPRHPRGERMHHPGKGGDSKQQSCCDQDHSNDHSADSEDSSGHAGHEKHGGHK